MEHARDPVPRPPPIDRLRSQPPPASKSEIVPPAERGLTYIEDEVVSIIARTAAEQVAGIHKLGESSFRSLFSRFGRSHGVDAEVGMQEAAVDVEVVVEFGFPIRDVAAELRDRVITTVEAMTGRRVVEVNIFVIDVHIPRTDRRHRRSLE